MKFTYCKWTQNIVFISLKCIILPSLELIICWLHLIFWVFLFNGYTLQHNILEIYKLYTIYLTLEIWIKRKISEKLPDCALIVHLQGMLDSCTLCGRHLARINNSLGRHILISGIPINQFSIVFNEINSYITLDFWRIQTVYHHSG